MRVAVISIVAFILVACGASDPTPAPVSAVSLANEDAIATAVAATVTFQAAVEGTVSALNPSPVPSEPPATLLPPTATEVPIVPAEPPPTVEPTLPPPTSVPPSPTTSEIPTPVPQQANASELLSNDDVAAEVGIFTGSSYYTGGLRLNCQFSGPPPNQTNRPRLNSQPNDLIRLFNFQPGESVRLFIFVAERRRPLVGWQWYQVWGNGQLEIQVTGLNSAENHVYAVLGNISGEVVDGSGNAPCSSIRQKVGSVVVNRPVRVDIVDIDENDTENVIGQVDLGAGQQFEVYDSTRTSLDELWWYAWHVDDRLLRINDDDVTTINYEVQPPEEPSEPSTEQTRPSPEAAIREYYTLIEQRQYDITWNRLSDSFKAIANPTGTDDYIAWWDTVARIDIGQVTLLSQTDSEARLCVDLAYVRFSAPTFQAPRTRIDLIWDPSQQQWLFNNTQQNGC